MSHQLSAGDILERMRDLEATVDDLQAELGEEKHERAKDRQRIAQLEDENAYLRETLEQVDGLEARVNKERAKLTRRVANVEDELGLDDQDVLALAEGGHDAVRESGLARLLEGGADAVTQTPTATYHRAEVLARNWIRWGHTKKQRGAVVERTLATQRDDLRTRLEDARGESLEWRQIYRAMQKVADLGPKNIRLTEDKHGKKLLMTVDGGDGR